MATAAEGTASVLMAAGGGRVDRQSSHGSLFDMQVEAGFVLLASGGAALVEMATASGLPLLKPSSGIR